MRLDGIHHVTCITADAATNVDVYAGVLGLRLVKQTVNFDAPDVYHLYYGDETGAPGSILTFFEYPGAHAGRTGAGMVHRIVWRVASQDALEFWERRLAGAGLACERRDEGLRFRDPEGLEHELAVADGGDEPLVAAAPGIPAECALQGLAGVQACSREPEASRRVLEDALGFTADGPASWVLPGPTRHSRIAYEHARALGVQRAGTVHHVAWRCGDDEQEAWRSALRKAGLAPSTVYDRQYFRSVYFREPSGVLFELATASPGFALDEPPDRLGEQLRLPPQYEALRPQLERTLRPIRNPRAGEAPS